MSGLEAVIREYYARIDQVDLDWVAKLFAPKAIYRRADSCYRGRDEIVDFFRNGRKIRGRHLVQDVLVDADRRIAVATGRFEGWGEAGDARAIGFADIWEFDATDYVTSRSTYLALGHAYVER